MNFDARDFETFRLSAGDVLLNEGSGSADEVGKPAVWEGQVDNCCFQNTLLRFRSNGLDPWFAHAFFKHSARAGHLVQHTQGVNIFHIGKKNLEQLPLPVAPLAEQRRIVAKLDALFARLARARAGLDRVTNLAEHARTQARASAFVGGLTRADRKGADADWPENKLGEVADVVTGSTPPTADKERYFGGDLPFFKPTDLDAGYFVRTPRETLTAEGADRARVVPVGTTLVTCIGATIGKAGLARVACAFNQQINAAVPKAEAVNPEWLYWAITSPQFRSKIIANSSATTMPIINKGRFQALRLRIPPLWEQAIIVERLEAIHVRADRLEAEATRARALLDRLEAAILTKAFKGELVPQAPNDEPASRLLERIRAQRAAAEPPNGKRGRRAPLSNDRLSF
ncbi:restriction endonuclease subunit S [Bradyrhizobium sp. SZCCHNRI20481]|uniref:restriction endonuclease subunit S n=1 Tax=Bradyrhizobium sp. SZCCHNRI20481 TaxID=3057286 RepID=UPI002916FFA0|nr:restriction endonuclease subunit S [Bradyrhizobium sp. SZCCHNRI20481]